MGAGAEAALKMVLSMKDEASPKVESLGQKLAGLGSTALKVGIGAAAAGIAALGAGLASTIGPASDLNETMSKVGVVFGKEAGTVLKFGETAAKALGMSKNEALAAAGTYGNLFRSMGMAESTSAKMSTGLVQLASDLASFNNQDPSEVLEKLRAGLTGETEPLKSLGVNMSQATIEAKAMAMGLWNGKGALDANAKAQASYALIMEQTSLAQGDFSRTSGGLANQQRILQASLTDLKATIGTALLPILSSLAAKLIEVFNSPEVQAGVQAIATWLGNLPAMVEPVVTLISDLGNAFRLLFQGDFESFAEILGNALYTLLEPLGVSSTFIDGLYDGLMTLSGAMSAEVPAAIGALQGAFGVVMGVLQQLGGMLLTVAQTHLMVLRGAFETVVGWVTANWPRIQAVVEQVMSAIMTVVQAVISVVVPFMQEQLGWVVAWVNENWPLIQQTIETVLNAILTAVETIVGAIRTFWEDNHTAIMTVVTNVWTIIKTIIETALQTVFGIIKAAMQAINGDWAGAWKTLQGVFENVWKAIKTILESELKILKAIFEGGINAVIAWFQGQIARFSAIGASIVEGIKQGISNAWGALVGWFQSQINGLIGSVGGWLGIGSPSKVFAAIGADIVAGLQQGITEGTPGATGGFSALANEFIAMFKQLAGIFWNLGSEDEFKRVNTVIDTMGALADLLTNGAKALTEAAAYVAASGLGPAVAAMITDLRLVLAQVTAIGGNVDDLKAVGDRMEQFERILTPMKTLTEGLKAIGEYMHKAGLRETWVTLQDDFRMVVNWMQNIAKMFDAEAIGAAATFSEAVGKIIGPMKSVTDGLEAIGEYEHHSGLRDVWTTLQDDFRMVVHWMTHIAEMFDGEGVDAAADFAKSAGGILGTMEQTVDGLNAIGAYEHKAGLRGVWVSLVDDMRMVVNWVKDLAATFDQKAIDAAEKFMATVAKVIAPVKAVIDTLSAIGKYQAQKNVKAAIKALTTDLTAAIEQLTIWLLGFVGWETFDTGKTLEIMGKIIQPVKTCIDALNGLDKYKKLKNVKEKTKALTQDLTKAVEQLQIWALSFIGWADDNGTAKILTAMGQIVAPVKAAIDALTALGKYTKATNMTKAVEAFRDDLRIVIDKIDLLADEFIGRGVGVTAKFMTSVGLIIDPIKTAIDTLVALGKYQTIKGLAAAIDRFKADLTTAIDKLQEFQGTWTEDELTDIVTMVTDLTDKIDAIGDSIKTMSTSWVNDVATAATSWKTAVGTAVSAIKEGVRSLQTLGSPTTPDLWQVGWNLGSRWVQGIVAGITSQLPKFDEKIDYVLGRMGGGKGPGDDGRNNAPEASMPFGAPRGANVVINFSYAPAVSFATREEAYTRIAPILGEALRRGRV